MLEEKLISLVSNLYAQYFNAHVFHWNIKGPEFVSLHEFTGELYSDVFESIDDFMEQIRQLEKPTPGCLISLLNNADISCFSDPTKPDLNKLELDNETVLTSLFIAYKEADDEKELGVANLIQDRIQVHKKFAWKLRALQNKE